MNPLHTQFERYSKGLLDDAGTEELNRRIVEAYFHAPESLDHEEAEYAEDLVIGQYLAEMPDENLRRIFRARMDADPGLAERVRIHENLSLSAEHMRELRTQRAKAAESNNEQEEEQLREILHEVVRKVEAEKESAVAASVAGRLRAAWQALSGWLNPDASPAMTRVRLAIVISSFALIIVTGWWLFRPGEPMPMATQSPPPAGTGQNAGGDQTGQSQATATLDENTRDRLIRLIVNAAEFEKIFDYTLMRGGTITPAEQAYIKAANHYNIREYDSCALILKDLLKKKVFTDRDTLSDLWFYLGNCYLIRGMRQNNLKWISLSLQSFDSVHRSSYFYKPSRYYSVFAAAKLGDPVLSLQILDTLAMQTYGRQGKVKMLRDSAGKIRNLP